MSESEEHVALCALNKIFGYHPILALKLMAARGGAMAVLEGPPPELREHPELAAQVGPDVLAWARGELGRVEAGGFRFVGFFDDDYPDPLRQCEDPPLGLYLNGCTSAAEIFGLRPLIGFVGTRDLSPYGREWCRKLVSALAEAPIQPCIVSGMAFGADGIAHQTALDCGLTTVGVLPTGIDRIYPWQHEQLARDIVGRPGCGLVTDYPMGTAPVQLNFLRRNRIIAGLVRAVVVVESRTRGGSLMTAKYACNYSRDVFAVPGRLDDIRSAGCNSLISSQMAQIVTTPEELVGQLGLGGRIRGAGGSWRHPAGTLSGPFPVSDPAGPEQDLLRAALERKFGAGSALVDVGLAVRENRGATVEQLAGLLGRPYQDVLAHMGILEANGIVSTDIQRRCALTAAWA